MTTSESTELARTLDEVIADAFPMETLLDVAANHPFPPPDRLAIIDGLGIRELELPEAVGGLDLDRRALGLLGWVAGRRLLPVAIANEVMLTAPILQAVGNTDQFKSFIEDRTVVGAGVHPVRVRGEIDDRAEVWSRAVPEVTVVATDDGRVCLVDCSLGGLQESDAIDRGQGRVLVTVPEASEWVHGGAIARAVRRWHLFVFAQLLGVAEHVTQLSVDYTSERYQFGRPIASFQAIGHMLADMYGNTELIRSTVSGLCGQPDDPAFDDAAWSAAASVPELAREVCEVAIQVHGGMGFTWEYGLHLYYRRTLQLQATLGGRTGNERAIGERLLAKES